MFFENKIYCQPKIVDNKIIVCYNGHRLEGVIMAVKLRLKRMGAKKKPFYRVVVADSRAKRDGKVIEEVGTYNPLTSPAEIKLNKEEIMKWLNNGAEPTDTVRNILSKEGILKEFHESKAKKGN